MPKPSRISKLSLRKSLLNVFSLNSFILFKGVVYSFITSVLFIKIFNASVTFIIIFLLCENKYKVLAIFSIELS